MFRASPIGGGGGAARFGFRPTHGDGGRWGGGGGGRTRGPTGGGGGGGGGGRAPIADPWYRFGWADAR